MLSSVRVGFAVFAWFAVVMLVPGVSSAELKGDVNQDGAIDFRDVVAATPSLKASPPEDIPAADVSPPGNPEAGDGQIKVDDIVVLMGGVTQEDYDGDGLSLDEENAAGTSPLLGDTDRDGLTDADELSVTGLPGGPTNPLLADSDGDAIPDAIDSLSNRPRWERVLVLYNPNSSESEGVADYYIQQRNALLAETHAARGFATPAPQIAAEQKCAVEMPPGLVATWEDLGRARDDILTNCVCPLTGLATCGPSDVDAIAATSPITHLVLVQGMPPAMAWPEAAHTREAHSFGQLLGLYLYRDSPIEYPSTPNPPFNPSLHFPESPYTQTYFGRYPDELLTPSAWMGHLRPVEPNIDRVAAFGVIHAMTPDRAKGLIDRTLAAERAGFSGNAFSQGTTQEPMGNSHRFLADLLLSNDPLCQDYENDGFWELLPAGASSPCRAGVETTSYEYGPFTAIVPVPGSVRMDYPPRIDTPVAAGYYAGNAIARTQRGFETFDTLTEWRRPGETKTSCTATCDELSALVAGGPAAYRPGDDLDGDGDVDQADADICTGAQPGSLPFVDFTGEVNPKCVGVADGFFAFQFRSFPASFFGFYPDGWTPRVQVDYGTQGYVVTPPTAVETGGHSGGFLRFGTDDAVASPQCGGAPCPEYNRLSLGIASSYRLDDSQLPIATSSLQVELRLRYRNSHATPAASLAEPPLYFVSNDLTSPVPFVVAGTTDDVFEAASPTTWREAVAAIDLPACVGQPCDLDLVYFRTAHGVRGRVDVDSVTLHAIADGVTHELMADSDGTFDAPTFRQTVGGGTPAEAVERLGGIAYFGNMSHLYGFGGGGTASLLESALFSGRTLGEGVLFHSNSGSPGVAVFGDPLYQPSAVKLTGPDPFTFFGHSLFPYSFWTLAESEITLYATAIHGRSAANVGGATQWEVRSCPGNSAAACNASNGWGAVVASGTGAAFAEPIQLDLMDFVTQQGVPEDFVFRLHVMNAGEPDAALASYAYFSYRSSPRLALEAEVELHYQYAGLGPTWRVEAPLYCDPNHRVSAVQTSGESFPDLYCFATADFGDRSAFSASDRQQVVVEWTGSPGPGSGPIAVHLSQPGHTTPATFVNTTLGLEEETLTLKDLTNKLRVDGDCLYAPPDVPEFSVHVTVDGVEDPNYSPTECRDTGSFVYVQNNPDTPLTSTSQVVRVYQTDLNDDLISEQLIVPWGFSTFDAGLTSFQEGDAAVHLFGQCAPDGATAVHYTWVLLNLTGDPGVQDCTNGTFSFNADLSAIPAGFGDVTFSDLFEAVETLSVVPSP